jgi:hypothetical protein
MPTRKITRKDGREQETCDCAVVRYPHRAGTVRGCKAHDMKKIMKQLKALYQSGRLSLEPVGLNWLPGERRPPATVVMPEFQADSDASWRGESPTFHIAAGYKTSMRLVPLRMPIND